MNREGTNQNIKNYLDCEVRRPKDGIVRINTNNTIPHEIVKLIVLYLLKKKKRVVFSEAGWKKPFGGIADVYDATENFYVEVLVSESNKMLENKTKDYPDIAQIVIRAKDVISDEEMNSIGDVIGKIREILP